MTYKFENWSLYKADVKLNGGRRETLYFFSRWRPKKGDPCDLPEGCLVRINERTGLPYINENKVLRHLRNVGRMAVD